MTLHLMPGLSSPRGAKQRAAACPAPLQSSVQPLLCMSQIITQLLAQG